MGAMKHIKQVVVWGLVLGGVLGTFAYGYLCVVGAQLEALRVANEVEQVAAANEQKRSTVPLVASQDIYLGNTDITPGEEYDIQAAYGYRAFQPTYDPRLGGNLYQVGQL